MVALFDLLLVLFSLSGLGASSDLPNHSKNAHIPVMSKGGYYVGTRDERRRLQNSGENYLKQVWQNVNVGQLKSVETDCIKVLRTNGETVSKGKSKHGPKHVSKGVSRSSLGAPQVLCDDVEEDELVTGASIEADRCSAVALEVLVTGLTSSTYYMDMDIVVEEAKISSADSAIIQKALQYDVAPTLTNCGEAIPLQAANVPSSSSNKPKNAVFGDVKIAPIECNGIFKQSQLLICLNVQSVVSVFGGATGVEESLSKAYSDADLSIPGLVKIEGVSVTKAPEEIAVQKEGRFNPRLANDPAFTAVQSAPKGSVSPDDGGLSPAAKGFIILCGVVLFAILFVAIVRRWHKQRRGGKRWEDPVAVDATDSDDHNNSILEGLEVAAVGDRSAGAQQEILANNSDSESTAAAATACGISAATPTFLRYFSCDGAHAQIEV